VGQEAAAAFGELLAGAGLLDEEADVELSDFGLSFEPSLFDSFEPSPLDSFETSPLDSELVLAPESVDEPFEAEAVDRLSVL
jgi:hypothetical protein